MSTFLSSHDDIVAFFGCTPILYATIRITGLCNLYCKHCYANASSHVDVSDEFDTNEMFQLLDELRELGVGRLSISGGEPFCRKDVYDILHRASDLGFDIYLSTNGTNNISVEKLSGCNIKVLQVSIDGLAKMHDEIRGEKGAFFRAVQFLKKMADCNTTTTGVAFSLMRQNINEALPLFRYLHDNELANVFSVIPVQKLGRAEQSDMLSAKELKSTLETLADYYLCSNRTVELNIMAPPAIVPTSLKNTKYSKGYVCEFPYSIAIDTKGNCAICDGLLNLREFINANIREDKKYYEHLFSSETSRKWLDTSPASLKGICQKCCFLDLCSGGCRVDSYLNTGDFHTSDPLCQRYYDSGIFPEEYLV